MKPKPREWLKGISNLGSSSASFDRVATPNGRLWSGGDAWPVIIR